MHVLSLLTQIHMSLASTCAHGFSHHTHTWLLHSFWVPCCRGLCSTPQYSCALLLSHSPLNQPQLVPVTKTLLSHRTEDDLAVDRQLENLVFVPALGTRVPTKWLENGSLITLGLLGTLGPLSLTMSSG